MTIIVIIESKIIFIQTLIFYPSPIFWVLPLCLFSRLPSFFWWCQILSFFVSTFIFSFCLSVYPVYQAVFSLVRLSFLHVYLVCLNFLHVKILSFLLCPTVLSLCLSVLSPVRLFFLHVYIVRIIPACLFSFMYDCPSSMYICIV